MRLFKFYFLFLLFWSVSFTAQNNNDSLKKRANSVIYEQPDESISIALKLLKGEKRVDEIAHLYMLISNAYIAKRNNDSSLIYILKAADLINKESLPTTKIKILNSVAVQYQQMELYDKALETLDQSLQLTEKLEANGKDRLFNAGFNFAVRGMIYRNQSNPDLALEKFKMAAVNFQKLTLDRKSAANLSIIYYNIGYCYIDLMQLQQASAYFQKSEEYAKTGEAKSLEAYALKGKGETLFLTQNYGASLQTLYEAEKMALPVGDLVLNEGLYKLIADNNLVLNDFEKFQNYNSKYLEIQKTLEQNDLKSLNRYLNTQNLEQQENHAKVAKEYRIYQWITIVIALLLISFLSKKIIDQMKGNRRKKKLIETLTKSKEAPQTSKT